MERTPYLGATVIPDTELGGYVARAVEVASQGETVEEVVANLREALELYFEDEETPELPTLTMLAPVDVRLPA
ncbi:hypothetical protein BJF83_12250 [Nocardiopsis sp. CNR-923]|uniref:type II toxin-antitoxin system HicB family antitoxin n=1 Tax=Nocardiopsis sp. CNR-923 TaxID=1904965 RepID=UPI0009691216|nr:type II toxin-antitoxin system HicB family antitoxin [Nocardiopsis sp. CNR-923]OLT29343.1 hypothetical protein BJF83_12250 [Nocardiopsis sp. CNR-923]